MNNANSSNLCIETQKDFTKIPKERLIKANDTRFTSLIHKCAFQDPIQDQSSNQLNSRTKSDKSNLKANLSIYNENCPDESKKLGNKKCFISLTNLDKRKTFDLDIENAINSHIDNIEKSGKKQQNVDKFKQDVSSKIQNLVENYNSNLAQIEVNYKSSNCILEKDSLKKSKSESKLDEFLMNSDKCKKFEKKPPVSPKEGSSLLEITRNKYKNEKLFGKTKSLREEVLPKKYSVNNKYGIPVSGVLKDIQEVHITSNNDRKKFNSIKNSRYYPHNNNSTRLQKPSDSNFSTNLSNLNYRTETNAPIELKSRKNVIDKGHINNQKSTGNYVSPKNAKNNGSRLLKDEIFNHKLSNVSSHRGDQYIKAIPSSKTKYEKSNDSVSSYLKNFLASKKPTSQDKDLLKLNTKGLGIHKTIGGYNTNYQSKNENFLENKRHSSKQMSTSINKGQKIEEKDNRFKYSVYQSILNNYSKIN